MLILSLCITWIFWIALIIIYIIAKIKGHWEDFYTLFFPPIGISILLLVLDYFFSSIVALIISILIHLFLLIRFIKLK
jgi:hypothetical protein